MTLSSRVLLLPFSFFAILCSCNAQTTAVVLDANGKEKLLGKVVKNDFKGNSFALWFNPGYEDYTVDQVTLAAVKEKLSKYKIKVFMGTWCGDSKREIPRFYKVLEASGFPMSQLSVVAVDYLKPFYKKSPGGEEKGLDIIKVPTFILFKDGKEVNRIVESPVSSLEKDLAAIVINGKYTPHYSDILVLPQD